MSIPIGNENRSKYAGQGRRDQRPVAAHAIIKSLATNSFTTPDSFGDFAAVANNSYEARLPVASPLTRNNVEQLNQRSGGRYSHAEWLAQHYEVVDQNPDAWFNSRAEGEGVGEVFDTAGAIEGEGMEEFLYSLHVGHDAMSQSIPMLSQYTSSFSRTSGSPSMFLPDMRRSLVHRPLALVPECHHVAANHFDNHDTHHRGSG